jgi:hypothetical protein
MLHDFSQEIRRDMGLRNKDRSIHFGAIGVTSVAMSRTEFLHAALQNLNVKDTHIKSVAVFDVPSMAMIVLERPKIAPRRALAKPKSGGEYRVTFHLRQLSTRTRMSELSYEIKSRSLKKIFGGRRSSIESVENDWIKAFHMRLTENIARAGAQSFPTLPVI